MAPRATVRREIKSARPLAIPFRQRLFPDLHQQLALASAPKDRPSALPATSAQPFRRLTDEPLNTMKSWLGPKGQ
jgi:hypothetical protein